MDSIQIVQTTVLCVIGLIATAMVPWGYIIERRLSRIETQLSNGIQQDVSHLLEKHEQIAKRLHEIEIKQASRNG